MSNAPLILLDVDGVLNFVDAADPSTRLRHRCVAQLNRIVAATGAEIVLSSTWRMLVNGRRPMMTLDGFRYMLHTHGGVGLKVIGCTAPDEHCPECGHRHGPGRRAVVVTGEGAHVCMACGGAIYRGSQITRWLADHPGRAVAGCVAIDDEDDGITERGHPLVLTDYRRGLAAEEADRAIGLLREGRLGQQALTAAAI